MSVRCSLLVGALAFVSWPLACAEKERPPLLDSYANRNLGGEAGADGASSGGSGSDTNDGSGGIAVGGGRKLVNVLTDAPWGGEQRAYGMTVDDDGRVFLADNDVVWVLEGDELTEYVNAADVSEATGELEYLCDIVDIEWGSDGVLYALTTSKIVQVTAAHTVTAFRDVPVGSMFFAQTSPDSIAVMTYLEGLSLVTESGTTPIYDYGTIDGASDCACEDLAMLDNGAFFYMRGCNGSPITVGNLDSRELQQIRTTTQVDPNPLDADNFNCVAKDPAGGYYVYVDAIAHNGYDQTTPVLFHFDEDATASEGYEKVVTTPTIQQAEDSQDEVFAFNYCSMAVAPSGDVYFRTMSQLWKVEAP